ncbi:MAG: EAL domain-containing protein [Butyrivibrio sp.]|nr:EAL domain-containing protein [Acetatifactor muris]MCM1558672.1 EAL domain-containing protein [Butyrivibrio sp.]
MKYVLHYDVAALVLTVIILIHFYHKKSIRMPQTVVFIWLLWISFVTDVLDIVTVVIDEYRLMPPVVNIVNVIYLIAFNVLPFLYYLYLFTSVRKNKSAWSWKEKLVLLAPVCGAILLIITSPATKLIFYYNQEEGYCHGFGFPLLYVATAIYMLATVVTAVKYRSVLTRWQKISVYFYLLASLTGIILQVLLPDILLLQFAVSLSLLLLYMSLESPDEDEDKLLGVYNHRGFEKVIANEVEKQSFFHVLAVNITNYLPLREAVGLEPGRALLKQMVEALRGELRPAELYCLADGKLAVIVGDRAEELNRVVKVLRDVFSRPVAGGDMNVQFETTLMQLDYPEEVGTLEDIMDSVDYFTAEPFESSDGEVRHMSGQILESRKRENRIQQIMQQALTNGTFQVYYQPIYSSSKGRFNCAEALVRLFDDELGFISPEEFIPIAEKNGMILKIGELVFRSACEMLAREKLWEKGIDYIEVNLSVVQCMQEDICEMLYGIMDEYDVPYRCINLEVTETILATDVLFNTMERMTVGGVTFSLDDYGTGYSNLSNVLKYPFGIVKLDKSMVWYAMENEQAMKALRHTVTMMRDLEMDVVAEGVETAEQRDILKEMGCEYLQGYFFSKPVSEADFLAKLEIA